MEIWKDIPGHPGYQVSTQGRVRSLDRVVITKRGSRRYRGKILRPGKVTKQGHQCLPLGKKSNGVLVHALVLKTFVGPRPARCDIRHLDGNPLNNALSNLCYGSRGENEQDKVFHGKRKFTVEDIQRIRASSVPGRKLAKDYACSESMISAIRTRIQYSQV